MKDDMKTHVRQCDSCQRNKISRPHVGMPLEITEMTQIVWEKCSMYIVGPLRATERGNRYVLTFQDLLSKYTIAVPLVNQTTKAEATDFVNEILFKLGIPQACSNFRGEMFRQICKLLKIKKIKTSVYRPQSNGAIEIWHRTLAEFLRHFITNKQCAWDR
ncbi:hypothetical protein PR048_000781 [Dryococelus australis]|uniref:Integrase catalytic domain-containing protein n=1 Tax=Dryococelus australis TaxID=614101 RepID=A0ABQ9IHY7_9NEOP|nr:hypothetical protein PR048_000781 [Dryococelus australis]